MPAYQPTSGASGIGALLRKIQESQQQSPLAQPPATQTGSAIRGLVQGPLTQSEAPDSSRVISVRPEGQGQVVAAQTPQTPTAPIGARGGINVPGTGAPAGPSTSSVVAAIRPAPQVAPPSPGEVGPGSGGPGGQGGAVPQSSTPTRVSLNTGPSSSASRSASLATRLAPSGTYVRSNQNSFTPLYGSGTIRSAPTNQRVGGSPILKTLEQGGAELGSALGGLGSLASELLPSLSRLFPLFTIGNPIGNRAYGKTIRL